MFDNNQEMGHSLFMKTPFKIGNQVFIVQPITAAGHFTGQAGTVGSLTNTGTKRNPRWRVYLGGIGYYDAEALSLESPV